MMNLNELMERAAQGEASPKEWDALVGHLGGELDAPGGAERRGSIRGEFDPGGTGASAHDAWRTIALGLREALALRSLGTDLAERMARVELPPSVSTEASPSERLFETTARAPVGTSVEMADRAGVPPLGWIERSLWVAALALAFLWTAGGGLPGSSVGPGSGLELAGAEPPVDRVSDNGPSEADALATGGAPTAPNIQVLDELPRLVMDTRPLIEGGPYEVFYMRRTLERAVVSELLEVGEDEYGEPVAIPVSRSAIPERDKF